MGKEKGRDIVCGEKKKRQVRKSMLIRIRVDSSEYWSLLMDTPRIVVIIPYSIDALSTLVISTLIDGSEGV